MEICLGEVVDKIEIFGSLVITKLGRMYLRLSFRGLVVRKVVGGYLFRIGYLFRVHAKNNS